jgi:hypothetical protein
MEAKLGRVEEEVREGGLKISRMLGYGFGRKDDGTGREDKGRGREDGALLLAGGCGSPRLRPTGNG